MTGKFAAASGPAPRWSQIARGAEAKRVDDYLSASGLPPAVRAPIWESAERILDRAPSAGNGNRNETGIAVGYVQSGKTTSFTALTGLAADRGFRVVIALLGSTNLLLDQNRSRLLDALDLGRRRDYKWIHFENPSSSSTSPDEISHYLSRGRVLLVTLLKHHGRISDAARILDARSIGEGPTLILDDEADQVSLNTRINAGEESSTYAAIRDLRENLGPHLYVQYTATPYAPLLLEIGDLLSPDFVELLQPGPGYVGGREFLIDNADVVIRPANDAPGPRDEPNRLPASLRGALAEFVVGAALLLARDPGNAPISMLVHPTGRKEPQRRYEFLLKQCIERWRAVSLTRPGDMNFQALREHAVASGAQDVSDGDFSGSVAFVLNEIAFWRVNSDEDASRTVQWNVSPAHVLVGGNKLDRGFTVEGLTVSWLGRPPSVQIDTTIQRARAYGYRAGYLPYCRIYGSDETISVLTSGVETELDMRAHLREWVDEGLPVSRWAEEIGLIIRPGLKPTRSQVVRSLIEFRPGWHLMNRPSTELADTEHNMRLVRDLGLLTAKFQSYGRLAHRTMSLESSQVAHLMEEWAMPFSPGWDRPGVNAWLRRMARRNAPISSLFISAEGGSSRTRDWDPALGFAQLMQGADAKTGKNAYPGDRYILPGVPQLQVHLVRPHQSKESMLAMALRVPDSYAIARRGRQ